MPDFTALISDLDDTLLTEHHLMTDRTMHTLKRLIAQGVKVILASGRSAASMAPFVERVGAQDPYIAYNGAQIVDPITGDVILSNEVPLLVAKEVLAWFEAHGVYAQYYRGADWFYEAPSPIAEDYKGSTGIPGICAGEKLSQHIKAPTPKVLAVDTAERVKALLPIAQAAFGDKLTVTTSKPYFIEVTAKTATKGQAVHALAERLGLRPETTLCAGDSLNDLTMLAWSRHPIAVSNARPEVKAAARYIAGDGRRDGMAEMLDKLIPFAGI